MNILKKMTIAASAVAVLVGSSFGAQLLTGGNIPLINNIVGVGLLSLDFSSPGTDVTIGTFIINNNSTSYDVSWSFANLGNFESGGRNIPFTALKINPSGLGTLGTGILALADEDILADANLAPGYTWNPLDQTESTINYGLLLQASWADPSNFLAGLYTETIIFSITATL